jgi:hypothetical protein
MGKQFYFILLFIIAANKDGLFANPVTGADKKELQNNACTAAALASTGRMVPCGNNPIDTSNIKNGAGELQGAIHTGFLWQNGSNKIVLFLIAFCVLLYGIVITMPKNMRIKEIEDYS